MPAAKQFNRSLTSFEVPSNHKWSKPAFQAFQLRPLTRDPEMEDSTKSSLGIFGPQSQIEMGRAKSVPARQKDTLLDRDEVRTAHSVAHMCEAISLKPKASLEALPTRPPLSKMKQIPGRYFPKPTPVESERLAHLVAFRRNKHPLRIRNYDRPTGNSKSLDMNDLPLESVSFLDVLPKSNRQKSPGFGRVFHRMKTNCTEFPEIRSEVFAICFNQNDSSRKGGDHVSSTLHVSNDNNISNNNGSSNIVFKNSNSTCDPNSELRSDYYTIKRISVTSNSSRQTSRSFSVVLRGHPKRLHPKLLSDNGCDFSEDNMMKGSKSVTSSLVGGGHQKEIPDSEKQTGSTKPSETSTAPKIKVKIDPNSTLAPIMINGLL